MTDGVAETPAGSALVGSRWFFLLVLVVLGVGWGSTQSLGKIATATGHQPFGLIFWQLVVGAVVLGAISAIRGKGLVLNGPAMRFYVVIAFIGTIIPNATFYAAVVHLPAGVMSILISTVPLIAFPMALALGIDRFSALRAIGLGLGILGVALIAAPGGEAISLWWLAVAMTGPVFYAIEATYVAKSGTAGMDALQAMFGVSVVGAVIAAPIALGTGQWVDPLPMGKAEGALVLLAAVHGLVYAAYVWLAGRAGSVFASQCAYLVTGSGVIWAMVLLGERLPPVVWVALAVMLAGVALVQPPARAEGVMFGLAVPADAAPWVAIAIMVVMFVLFVLERTPVEVTAIGGVAAMLILGILPVGEAVSVLSNPAPWTIALMFLVMGGLVRTGAVEMIISTAARHVGDRPKTTIAALLGFTAVASAFMNNTPLVAVMIPVVIQIAVKIGTAPSKLLIPLSYMTVLGGMITLIGTSTNILVDGVAVKQGLEHFSLFEIAPLGIAVTLAGGLFLALFGNRLLPERQSMGVLLNDRRKMKFFTEVAVPEDSTLIGQAVQDVDIFKREGVRVIDVLRGDASLRRDLTGVTLAGGDRVVLRTEMAELMGLQARKDVHLVDKLSSVKTETVEVLIGPGCRMEGQRLGDLRLRRRYGVYVLAVHRRNQNIGRQLDDLIVRVGDTLLLEGAIEDIQRLAADMDLVDISRPRVMAFRRAKAPIALAALALIVGLAALDVAPILPLALIGVAVILVTHCVDSDEAFSFVDGRLLAMIFAMLAIGEGLDKAGAVDLIVTGIAPWLLGLGPFALILAVYLIGLILTEFLSNNAVAVIYTPIAIQLALELGHDPRPFVVAVMFSATLAFATPVGYQTNMMVYGPGGYRFLDFTRVGLPLNIIVMLVACALIPVIWPL